MLDRTTLAVSCERDSNICFWIRNLQASILLSSRSMERLAVDGTTLKLRGFCALCDTWRNLMRTHSKSQSLSIHHLLNYVSTIRAFMDGVKEGRIRITASKLPSFIYDEAMYDGMRKSMGCLRGYYLKQVCFICLLCVYLYDAAA